MANEFRWHRLHWLHFAICYELDVTGLEYESALTSRRQRAEHANQSHLGRSAVFPLEPVIRKWHSGSNIKLNKNG
jgi:hypothetical protein